MLSPRSQETWDCMLSGPPSRSPGGLLACSAGSSVVVADPRSMHLAPSSSCPPQPPNQQLLLRRWRRLLVLHLLAPLSSPSSPPSAGCPQPLSRDLSALDDASNSHLRLAVGDRQGRVALWDFRSCQVLWVRDSCSDRSRLGIQDLCWVCSASWLLASFLGPSLLALWDAASGRCLWKYAAAPEYLSCIRGDPFDSRYFCAVGLRGRRHRHRR